MDKKVIKSFLKKKLILWSIFAVLAMGIVFFSGSLFNKAQIMDHLDYNITLNEDGSATIVETWDVYVQKTNTLFRNFKSSSKYGKVTDVKVKDLETGKELKQIDEEMYHVTKDCYYALDISSGKFEIAWGIGMDNSRGKKKYQITYTVTNLITDYNDCQEFYWKLLDESNGIPIKKVTGTIKFPDSVKSKDNLKAWGHGPLNGNIEIASNDIVKFTINNLPTKKMLEIRAVTLDKMFDTDSSKIKDLKYLNTIIGEETNWANKSNEDTKNLYFAIGIIYVVACFVNILKAIRFYKISRKKDDGIIHNKIVYYRDIPRDGTSTPPEASYLYYFDKDKDIILPHQADVVSATILNLALKKYISLRSEGEKVYVSIIKKSDGLNEDEEAIYKIIEGTSKLENGEFEIGKINDFAKKYYDKYSNLITKMVNESRESIYKQKLVDKANKKQYSKAKSAEWKYSFVSGIVQFLIIALLIGLLPIFNRAYILMFEVGFKETFAIDFLIALPFIATILLKLKFRAKTQDKIAVLTQEGTEEQEKWKGLAKFLKEFSLIKEREVPELAIWEKYLVYATAFGIADKAIEQMKAKYPEVFVEEYWKDEQMQQYQVLRFATYNAIYAKYEYSPIQSLNHLTGTAYKTSLTEIALHSSSSGSGGGGGFSGGGRRPEVAVAGMRRKIKDKKITKKAVKTLTFTRKYDKLYKLCFYLGT